MFFCSTHIFSPSYHLVYDVYIVCWSFCFWFIMAVMLDAAAIEVPDGTPRDVMKAQIKLRCEGTSILLELDDCEAMSVVFLALQGNLLARHGYRLSQYLCRGQAKETFEQLVELAEEGGGGGVLVEALYIIGRYDLLEDQLGLPVNFTLHQFFKREIGGVEPDRKAMYCVCAGMAQEQTDHLLATRLEDWCCSGPGRPLEETFVRNLTGINYHVLLNQLYQALLAEQRNSLASCLQPFIMRPPSPPRTSRSFSEDLSPYERDVYPLPTGYPHGLCVIINIKTFMKPRGVEDNFPLVERHGSQIDKERLTGTFKLFGFHVMHFDNPDYQQLQQFFRRLRMDPRLAVVACLAVCVMTHGDENAILLQQDNTIVTHSESDCLISAATVQGYTAVRSQTEGSWYITDLCQALQEYGHIMPIKNVLQKTRQNLKSRMGSMNNTYVTQLSEEKVTLIRDVQLVRAEEEHFLEGITILTQLEVMEKLLEEALEEIIESDDNLESLISSLINIRFS
ncbi:caspase-8-like isoform X3 [Portunus trituberculatus]|uniref:caspase-8-like isoform X3 n=1 Tax=Portunus trituberculatus TaxID=210409 RepID=UPI001E1CBC41|nr:caspase-8-like isoform X3 [Portunus trituberculatus]